MGVTRGACPHLRLGPSLCPDLGSKENRKYRHSFPVTLIATVFRELTQSKAAY